MPLSSKERMLAALRNQESDHVPFLLHTFGFPSPAPLRWSNAFEEARSWLSIGLDAWLGTGLYVPPSLCPPHPGDHGHGSSESISPSSSRKERST